MASDQIARRLAAIVEFSDDAIIGKDLYSVITDWNQGAEKIFGYTAAEMVGTSIKRLIPADRLAEEDFIIGKVSRGEKVDHFETMRQRKDGQLIHVSVTASPIRDEVGNIVGVSKIARDITAQKEREHEVRRLTQLYAALSQVNQAIVWSPTREVLLPKVCQVLIEFGGFHMVWIGWHDAGTQRILPIARAGLDTNYADKIEVYADDRPEGRGPCGTAFRTGQPSICNDMHHNPMTLPWRKKLEQHGFNASAAFPIRVKDVVRGVLTVYSTDPWFFREREISLLKEAAGDISFALDNFAEKETRTVAERVAEDERRFSMTMIESMPGIVYFYDEQGRFLRWNRNFEIVSGYSAEEIARMHPLDFFSPEERGPLRERITEVFTKGDSFAEASFISKSGRATPFFFTGRRVELDGQRCLVGMGVDISERKRAEQALRVLNQTLEFEVSTRTRELQEALVRAEAADRLKSAFLATMSHELRTPLNSIIGFTGILLQGLAGPLTGEQNKQLGMVQNSARHLLALINDVLDLSKIEAGQLEIHPERFDLRTAVEHVVGLVQPQVGRKELVLKTELPADLGEVISDRRRVEQVLLNLLSNGIKFTERGEVRVIAEKKSDGDGRPVVRLRVVDTGMGIKPDDLAGLFQPFRQVDSGLSRQHEGTGLGLAICRRLATLLGGEIFASSEWGKGSEFTLVIPQQLP